MSLVKVAGNASGTGTITIQAPNTNTNYTLDLPAAAGTIQLSGNAISGTTGTFSGTISGGSTIGVGGATPANTGAGITFPATQSASSDANTLDDYEEGTWTPAIRGSGTAGTYELSTAVGVYTKIGNLVTISCRILFAGSITGGGTGYLQITGIPFSNGDTSVGAVTTSGLDFTTNYSYLIVGPAATSGTTTWFLQEVGDNVSYNDFPISGVSANDRINFTATFRT